MHKSKEQLYNQIKDLKTEQEFKTEINELQKEYDDLFDEDTAALLIVASLIRSLHCLHIGPDWYDSK